jgi:hypothetical protein
MFVKLQVTHSRARNGGELSSVKMCPYNGYWVRDNTLSRAIRAAHKADRTQRLQVAPLHGCNANRMTDQPLNTCNNYERLCKQLFDSCAVNSL